MKRRPFRRRPGRTGGAMLELVVVLPFLILLAIGVTDFGKVYFTSVAVANAARAGAEWGAFSGGQSVDQAGIEDFAKYDGAEVGAITVTSNRYCRCGATATACTTQVCSGYGPPRVYIEVTASQTVNFILKWPGVPPSITVSRTATFRAQ